MSIVDTCSNVISVNSFKGKTDDSLSYMYKILSIEIKYNSLYFRLVC